MFTCLPIIPRKKGRKNCLLLLSGIKHVPFRGIQARCESPPKVWGYFSLFTHFGLLPLKPRKRHLLVGHGLLPEIWLVSLHPQPHWPSTSSFSLPWNSLIRHPLFAPCFRLLYNWVIFRWLKTLDIANKWKWKRDTFVMTVVPFAIWSSFLMYGVCSYSWRMSCHWCFEFCGS